MQVVPLALLALVSPTVLGLAIYGRLFSKRHPVEAVAFGWGTGWILVNVVLLTGNQILGIAFSQGWVLGLSLAFLGFAFVLASQMLPSPPDPARRLMKAVRDLTAEGASVLLLGPAILLLLIFFKATIYPETGPDSLFYHLYLPRVAFSTGFLPKTASLAMLDLPNAYPNLLVTQHVWVYFVAGSSDQVLSRPIAPLYTLLIILLLLHVCRPLGKGTGALALLLWTSFQAPQFLAFGQLSVEIWSDMPVTFYTLLALHFALRWLRRGEGKFAAYSGFFAGGAALVKYNGLLFTSVIGLVVLVASTVPRAPRPTNDGSVSRSQRVVPASLFLGFAAMVTLPLFLRNLLLFENPIYPFLTPYLGGVNLEASAFLAQYEEPPLLLKATQSYLLLSSFALLLFLLSLSLRDMAARFLQATAFLYLAALLIFFQFESAFWRLILPALPPTVIAAAMWIHRALYGSWRPSWAVAAWAASVLALILLPSIHLLAVSGALLALVILRSGVGKRRARLSSRGRRALQIAALITLSLSLFYPSLQAASLAKYPTPTLGPLPTGVPLVDGDEVLSRRWESNWRMWNWMNDNLPAGASIMTLDISRYYVEATYVSPASPPLISHYTATTLEEAIQVLSDAGVDYILDVAFFQSYRGTQPFWQNSPIFQNLNREQYFELIHAEADLRLYRLRF